MQGARGLPASEEVDGCRHRGIERRRQGEARPDNERKQNEDDRQIGDALDNVVGVAFRFAGRGAAEIFCEDFADGAQGPGGRSWKQVFAEVSCDEARGHIDQSGEDQNPCGLKVEIAAPAVLVGQDVVVARGNGISRGGDWYFEERGSSRVAGFAPIESRMRDDDLSAGDEQSEEGDYGEPVRDADEYCMPASYSNWGWGSGCHAQRIA